MNNDYWNNVHVTLPRGESKKDYIGDQGMKVELEKFSPKVAKMMQIIVADDSNRKEKYRSKSNQNTPILHLRKHFIFLPTSDGHTLFEGERDDHGRFVCKGPKGPKSNNQDPKYCLGTLAWGFRAYGIRFIRAYPGIKTGISFEDDKDYYEMFGLTKQQFAPKQTPKNLTWRKEVSQERAKKIKEIHHSMAVNHTASFKALSAILDYDQGDTIDLETAQKVCRALGGKADNMQNLKTKAKAFYGTETFQCKWKGKMREGKKRNNVHILNRYRGMLDSRNNKAALQLFFELIHEGTVAATNNKKVKVVHNREIACNYKRAIMFTETVHDETMTKIFTHPLNQDGLIVRFIAVHLPRAVGMNVKPADFIHKLVLPDNIGTDVQSSARIERACGHYPHKDNLSECIADQPGGAHWRCETNNYNRRFDYEYEGEEYLRETINIQAIADAHVESSFAAEAEDCEDMKTLHKRSGGKSILNTNGCSRRTPVIYDKKAPYLEILGTLPMTVHAFMSLMLETGQAIDPWILQGTLGNKRFPDVYTEIMKEPVIQVKNALKPMYNKLSKAENAQELLQKTLHAMSLAPVQIDPNSSALHLADQMMRFIGGMTVERQANAKLKLLASMKMNLKKTRPDKVALFNTNMGKLFNFHIQTHEASERVDENGLISILTSTPLAPQTQNDALWIFLSQLVSHYVSTILFAYTQRQFTSESSRRLFKIIHRFMVQLKQYDLKMYNAIKELCEKMLSYKGVRTEIIQKIRAIAKFDLSKSYDQLFETILPEGQEVPLTAAQMFLVVVHIMSPKTKVHIGKRNNNYTHQNENMVVENSPKGNLVRNNTTMNNISKISKSRARNNQNYIPVKRQRISGPSKLDRSPTWKNLTNENMKYYDQRRNELNVNMSNAKRSPVKSVKPGGNTNRTNAKRSPTWANLANENMKYYNEMQRNLLNEQWADKRQRNYSANNKKTKQPRVTIAQGIPVANMTAPAKRARMTNANNNYYNKRQKYLSRLRESQFQKNQQWRVRDEDKQIRQKKVRNQREEEARKKGVAVKSAKPMTTALRRRKKIAQVRERATKYNAAQMELAKVSNAKKIFK